MKRNAVQRWAAILAIFGAGVAVGGYLFMDTQPRVLLVPHPCRGVVCDGPSAIAGLAASVGLRLAPGLLPLEIAQSGRCVAMANPRPDAPVDLVVIPKKDIRDIAHLSPDDMPYIQSCFALIGQLVRARHLTEYRILTNGIGLQKVQYLHFHILAR